MYVGIFLEKRSFKVQRQLMLYPMEYNFTTKGGIRCSIANPDILTFMNSIQTNQ